MPRRAKNPPAVVLIDDPIFSDPEHHIFAGLAECDDTPELRAGLERAARQFLYSRRLTLYDAPSLHKNEIDAIAKQAGQLVSKLDRLTVLSKSVLINSGDDLKRADEMEVFRKAIRRERSTVKNFDAEINWDVAEFGIRALEKLALRASKHIGRDQGKTPPVDPVNDLIGDLLHAAKLEPKTKTNAETGEAYGPQVKLVSEVTKVLAGLDFPAFALPDDNVEISPEAVKTRIYRHRE